MRVPHLPRAREQAEPVRGSTSSSPGVVRWLLRLPHLQPMPCHELLGPCPLLFCAALVVYHHLVHCVSLRRWQSDHQPTDLDDGGVAGEGVQMAKRLGRDSHHSPLSVGEKTVQSQNLWVGSRTGPALDGSIPQFNNYSSRGEGRPSGSAGHSVGSTLPWHAFHGSDVDVASVPWD